MTPVPPCEVCGNPGGRLHRRSRGESNHNEVIRLRTEFAGKSFLACASCYEVVRLRRCEKMTLEEFIAKRVASLPNRVGTEKIRVVKPPAPRKEHDRCQARFMSDERVAHYAAMAQHYERTSVSIFEGSPFRLPDSDRKDPRLRVVVPTEEDRRALRATRRG